MRRPLILHKVELLILVFVYDVDGGVNLGLSAMSHIVCTF